MLQLRADRFVDCRLGEMPDKCADNREDCQINDCQVERADRAARPESRSPVMDSTQKVAIITGASRGIGAGLVSAYRMLGFAALNICVLKVDDDIRAVPDGFDPRYIISLADAHDYFGFLIDTRVVGFYRWWHFGKCADAALNASPYSMIATADYARGPAYVLSSRAVATLAQASIYYCRHFEIEGGYEDLAVGKALNAYDIHPANFDLEEKGLVYSTDSAS